MSKVSANGGSGSGKQASRSAVPYRRFFWVLAASWTFAAGGSLAWNLAHNARELRYTTFQTAQALLEKDLLYRQWSILHGGVYIPRGNDPVATPGADDANREVVTVEGKRLTLLNPAMVSREIFALQDQQLGVRARITSLTPIRPANRPDAWERQALETFANGAKEASTIEKENGERLFRIMRPLVTVPDCLNCHEETGRRPGEIRGGISLSVPMSQFAAQGENMHLAVAHGGLWVIGLAGLVLGVGNLGQHSRRLSLAEQRTAAALKEKEALLQEIHHRVKNNLQVISSLLQLQINELKDPRTVEVFRESQLRVRSMALIHEKLYQSESLACIDAADYVRSLATLLFSTYTSGQGRVRLELDLTPAFLSINTAIPLGLIANELISNSLKFAFPEGRQGVIRVELASTGEGAFRFRVADDGIGLPRDFVAEKSPSLGMRLVKILARQLEARASWEDCPVGTSFVLEFHDVGLPEQRNHLVARAGAEQRADLSPG